MNNRKNAEYAPNEKKVWRPVSATQCIPPEGQGFEEGIYFIGIEELQGAWIDDVWEEAGTGEGIEEFEEKVIIDDEGRETVHLVRVERPRARRYVLKRFTESGFAENAFASYNGPRQYK